MKIYRRVIYVLFLLGCNPLYSQWNTNGKIEAKAMFSTNDELPFWMFSNERGRIDPETNFYGRIQVESFHSFNKDLSLSLAGGLGYSDGISNTFFIDEAYASLNYKYLQFTVGKIQKKELYNGLSATNQNILWSLNSQPLPGIVFTTTQPVYFSKNHKTGFEATWSEYQMEKDRAVMSARLHHKSFHFIYNPDEKWNIKAGIQHFAQWGGDSRKYGSQPSRFSDYLKVVTGREGGKNAIGGDQQNVLGNHLGSYELYVSRKFSNMNVQFIYNSIFEDGSGSSYSNFPDGRYGIYYENNKKEKLVSNVIYEFYYTHNRSRNYDGPHNLEQYFNNFLIYNSGWTYKKRIMGVPFFDYDTENSRVINDDFIAHHIGIGGVLSKNGNNKFPYKLMMTQISYYGAPVFIKYREVGYLDLLLELISGPFSLGVELSSEYRSSKKPIYGAGIKLTKEL